MSRRQHIVSQQRGGVVLPLLLVLFVAGLAALIYGVSSDSSQPDSALFTVSYLFLMGISQAGVVFSAITRLVEADWSKPYYRFAEFSTLAFFPFAIVGLIVIVAFARDDLFYWLNASPDDHLSPWLNLNWLLIRGLGAMLLFYGVSFWYVKKAMSPDLAAARGQEVDADEVERQLYLFSPVVLILFVLTNTFFAWDFAMMLIPHWHSTVFPIHFWFGNVFAGCAALILFVVIARRTDGADSAFGPHEIKSLGMLVTGFTLMWLYFFWAQFFVIWFGNLPHETDALWKQMYGHYGPFFWIMLSGCFFVPFVSFLFAVVKRSVLAMCIIAIGINAGIWINKYLMIVPVFSSDHVPFSNWLDILLALGLMSGFAAIVIFMARKYPRYSRWEMQRQN
ncbi:MAG: polysulfide reductase NrfD [Gammaproteobacteria bacterium]|nr:polysulfide reductase NrfD [Gammaproteobacteria bacterium]